MSNKKLQNTAQVAGTTEPQTLAANFTGSVTLEHQRSTLVLNTQNTYVPENITMDFTVTSASLTTLLKTPIELSVPELGYVGLTVSSSNQSGIAITTGTISPAEGKAEFTITSNGWIDTTQTQTITISTATHTGSTSYLTSITLSTPSTGTNSITINDPQGSWIWEVDVDGNTCIY